MEAEFVKRSLIMVAGILFRIMTHTYVKTTNRILKK